MSEYKIPNHLKEKIDGVTTMSEYKNMEKRIKLSSAGYELKAVCLDYLKEVNPGFAKPLASQEDIRRQIVESRGNLDEIVREQL